MYLLHVAGRKESFGGGQPDNPVVDVGIEPVHAAVQLIGIFFADLETYTCIVAETMLVSQIGIATGQEIEVIQRRETVIA